MSKHSREAPGSQARLKILAMVLGGAGLLVLGAVAWVSLPKPQSTAASETYNSVAPVAVSFPAPALELSDLQGGKASLKDYRGQVVLVNNWATWCPPCRAEMPTLDAYFEDHRDQGFTLIGIEAGVIYQFDENLSAELRDELPRTMLEVREIIEDLIR